MMMRLFHTTTNADGATHTQIVTVARDSRVGRLFGDPTVARVTIDRTPDGAILRGAKTDVYERT
jgi:hypothetical protein